MRGEAVEDGRSIIALYHTIYYGVVLLPYCIVLYVWKCGYFLEYLSLACSVLHVTLLKSYCRLRVPGFASDKEILIRESKKF